jgi:predicted alpha/beta-fold hydrolase
MFIAHQYPKAPLLGLGFSLGANVMTRYLAEEGHRSRLMSGCALACVSSSVFQITPSSDKLTALGLETKF